MITQTPEFKTLVTKRTTQQHIRRRSRRTGKVVTDEALAQRREQAMALRIGGATYRQIAQQLDVNLAAAYTYVQTELLKTARQTNQQAELLRGLELCRLDKLWLNLWPDKQEPRVASVLVRISESRRKLLGLDLSDQPLIPQGAIMRFFDALTESILQHVEDVRVRRRIADEFNRVVAAQNFGPIIDVVRRPTALFEDSDGG